VCRGGVGWGEYLSPSTFLFFLFPHTLLQLSGTSEWFSLAVTVSLSLFVTVCLVFTVAVLSPMTIVHAPLSIRAYVRGHVEV
jgi:hypothetical protein